MSATGITLPYEKQAQRGDEMPTGLNYPDQLMFQALALLYARYRLKAITREQAITEKKQLLDEYRVFQYKWGLGDHYVAVTKATEAARALYRKNKTLDNADNLLASIEGVRI